MEQRRWLNQGQPQTLVIATVLLYLNAAFVLINVGAYGGLVLPMIAGYVAGGWGIANEQKWGYAVAVGVAGIAALLSLQYGDLIGLMFDVALVALLLHPQSRDYQKIWFR